MECVYRAPRDTSMSDLTTPAATTQNPAEPKVVIARLFAGMNKYNEQMHQDQIEIDRLKVESRIISAHTDTKLARIEAQVLGLQKGT